MCGQLKAQIPNLSSAKGTKVYGVLLLSCLNIFKTYDRQLLKVNPDEGRKERKKDRKKDGKGRKI